MRIRSDNVILGALVLLVLCAGLAVLYGLWRLLQPDPSTPDLAGTPTHAVLTRTAEPEPPPEAAPAPAFEPDDVCPLEVVLAPEDGAAIGWAGVLASSTWFSGRFETVYGRPVGGNTWVIDACPCDVVDVEVRTSHYAWAERPYVDAVVERSITIPLVRGVWITGTVTGPGGEPIPGEALVGAGGMTYVSSIYASIDTGTYGLRVDPSEVRWVKAQAKGYLAEEKRLRLAPDATEDVVMDFVLQPARVVTVWCAGLPDDSCAPVVGIRCTRLLLPFGEPCFGDPVECPCPQGRVAIRGGGASVEVPPGATVAWLDLRSGGRLTGRVVQDGEPAICEVSAFRHPENLIPDLRNGVMASMRSECDAEGRFALGGLKPGVWSVDVEHEDLQRSVPSVSITAGEEKDLGEIDLGAGGTIEGVVIDALTGQGTPGKPVGAQKRAGSTAILDTPVAISGPEGRFRLMGLDDGEYDVGLMFRPLTHKVVTVRDGKADREVTLETGDADVLEENGFSLETDEEGNLVVASVDPEGAAAGNGLEEGDRVDGLEVGGIDVGSVLPDVEDEIMDAVLDHYSGPGVSLLVERGEATVRVRLE